jgi:hypothetical protein
MKISNNIIISTKNQQNAYFKEEKSLLVDLLLDDVNTGVCGYNNMIKTDVKLMTKIAKSINPVPKIDFNNLWI